jgi:hypothetical protein
MNRDPAMPDFVYSLAGPNRGYRFKSAATVVRVMVDQCATCGAADVILFSCGHCGEAFCADHEPPDHSCSGPHPDESVDEAAFDWGATPDGNDADEGFEWGPREHAGEDAFAANGFRAAPVAEDGPAPRTPEPGTPAVGRVPRSHEGDATPAVRPLPERPEGPGRPAVRAVPDGPAPEPAPAAEPATAPTTAEPAAPSTTTTATSATTATPTSDESSPVRAMDTERAPGRVDRNEPRTLRQWLDQQTYLSLSAKTAALATLINGALYAGMFLTAYGLTP